MKHFIFLNLMACCTALVSISCTRELETKDKFPEIWQPGVFNLEAHRGLSDLYPENTELSFHKAVEAVRTGAAYRGMETDVQMTMDSVLVCMHDNTLKRTTGAPGAVSDYTFADLETLDAGHGEKVPLLATYLDLCREGGLIPYVELKSVLPEEGIPMTIDLIHEKGYKDGQFVITSFSKRHLEIASSLCDTPMEFMAGSFRVSWLDSLPPIRNLVLRPSSMKLTKDFADECHSRNIPLECYGLPVGDRDLYLRLQDWGVLGVTCNSFIFTDKQL